MIEFKDVTAVLITKDDVYPMQVLESVARRPFKEIFVRTKCESVEARYDMAFAACTPWVYFQDDDAVIPSIVKLLEEAEDGKINTLMKPHYIHEYKDLKCCLLGWGSLVPISMIVDSWNFIYTNRFDRDWLFLQEADRVFTAMHYPQNRIATTGIEDLPWALAKDRLSMAGDHAERRCKVLENVAMLEEEINEHIPQNS